MRINRSIDLHVVGSVLFSVVAVVETFASYKTNTTTQKNKHKK